MHNYYNLYLYAHLCILHTPVLIINSARRLQSLLRNRQHPRRDGPRPHHFGRRRSRRRD